MRKRRPIDALFPRVRTAILAATVTQPDRWWYLSDLARHLKLRPSSLQRELRSLVNAGILRYRRDGNRIYFQPDPQCPFLAELQGLMTKTAGLVDVLRDGLRPLQESIRFAFVYGSVARSEEGSSSDVDLMVIGQIGLADLAPTLRKIERPLARSVNPTVFTPDEFTSKLRKGHHLIDTIRTQPRLFVVGTSDQFDAFLALR